MIGLNGSGAITGNNQAEALLSAQIEITAGQNYTSYLIGNTWSGYRDLRLLTVEDSWILFTEECVGNPRGRFYMIGRNSII
ncbi:MAG: hypothetical protein ACLUD2_18275 [Clostridium sp.]